MSRSRFLSRVGLLALLVFVAFVLSAAVFKDSIYTPLDREFYLTDEQIAFVRPGLNIELTEYEIAVDGTVSVIFTVTDRAGLPLDLDGVFTPGPIVISFIIARIPRDAEHYEAYRKVTQTSPITGDSALQPAADAGGRIERIEIGTYRYVFGQRLPEGFDRDATHAIGFYAERNLSEFDLGAPMADGVVQFVPSGAPVEQIRELVADAACSDCHGALRVHGRRQSYQLCIMCHYPGVIDPDTGNSVDMAVMTHKIHRGADLPSVRAGNPYRIIGFRQSVHDYSDVHFPQDIRNCDSCHVPEAAQHDAYLLNPTRRACGSCHDAVNFATGEGHVGGPAVSDRFCGNCHFPEGELEFDASVRGAHTIPAQSRQLEGINVEILDVSNAGPGQAPSVLFRMTSDEGDIINPADLAFFNLLIAGPTTDYTQLLIERAVERSVPVGPDGEYSFSFNSPIPEDAEGTFSIGAEAYRNVLLNPGTTKQFSHRETAENPVFFFAVTDGEPAPRRQIVADEKCEDCHGNLNFHGAIRHNATDYCQVCHNPLADDSPFRSEDMLPARSIDFKFMIHRIHMGADLTRDYTLVGRMGAVANFNELRYPNDLRDCEACHLPDTYNVPTPGVVATIEEHEFFSPIPPNSAACLGCHDSVDAAAHTYTNITFFGEACGACHGSAREFSVARVHAR